MAEFAKPPWETERRLLVRIDAESSPEHGEDPYKRPIEKLLKTCILNIDKPRGPTSHEIAFTVKELLDAERAGHGGTLDPAVSGVLPILVNDATKCAGAVMKGGKEYVCIMRLHGDVSDDQLEEAIKFFTGDIYQVPPVRSSVARTLRVRTIYRIELLERDGRNVLMKVACSGGTYIRKLCHDIGLYLGCGAHMQELRRTRAGPFTEDESHTLLDIYSALRDYRESGAEEPLRRILRPVEEAVKHMPKIYVLDTAVDAICHGANLAVAGVARVEDSVKRGEAAAIMTLKGELVALAEARMNAEEMIKASHGIAAKTERVIMERGTYPPIWKGGRRRVRT
ncbi:MAG: RNA-guided pseudouridylation complex pseudouridine synthase subunit Cbf5 [Candidatus Wolframiiraptor sp.]|nr:MAG: RNA-guided pseudouridylation complex pseudouridine synthase subunit Cbf5 [Candidatus Wolframiiraptor sp.]